MCKGPCRHTPHGARRIARYKTKIGWFVDLDVLEFSTPRDANRYRVFYGPSVIFMFAARHEAFAFMRDVSEREGMVACPYVAPTRASMGCAGSGCGADHA